MFVRHSCPGLFITINPNDINNPFIIRFLTKPADREAVLTQLERCELLSHDPMLATKFFDAIIETREHPIRPLQVLQSRQQAT
jgi:hypothetical protein